jgi:predicted ATPase
MLTSITLKFTQNTPLILDPQGITIFVGPNNSGKSLALREIDDIFLGQQHETIRKIVCDFDIKWPSDDETLEIVKELTDQQPVGTDPEILLVGRINPNIGRENHSIHKQTMLNVSRDRQNKKYWAQQILKWGAIRLDGRSRFNLTNDQIGGDLLESPQNVLSHLFQDDHARKETQELIHDALGLYFVIDPTKLGTLRIRLSATPPTADEQSLNDAARTFYANATHIKDASDGVQAYTGIITAIMSGDFHTILVDEPEAFLHPPLARKLGKHLATISQERGGALFAATHSPDFLMGCVQASKNIRIVRLEHSDGKSRGRMVDPTELEALFKNPLMRSANAISGLFYDGVVVTESDNDRAFYGEIYHRLSAHADNLPSVLFVNAQNKQTIKDIIGPLRRFGVPAAAIPDVDLIKDGGKTWTDWLSAAQMPVSLHSGYQAQRTSIKSDFEASGKDMKSDGGVSVLDGDRRLAADQFFDNLAEYGIFVVRGGELESWLSKLKVPGKKTDWTVAMLERLGSDPGNASYVQPGHDDVWAFMSSVVNWIKNPARRGTS